jgi:hypothetical protein
VWAQLTCMRSMVLGDRVQDGFLHSVQHGLGAHTCLSCRQSVQWVVASAPCTEFRPVHSVPNASWWSDEQRLSTPTCFGLYRHQLYLISTHTSKCDTSDSDTSLLPCLMQPTRRLRAGRA